jgi:hypothetical protein
MSAAGNHEVGAMQILAADGEWKFGLTDRDDPGPGNGRARARIYHFHGNHGPATPGCLPHPARAAMVTICPNEARLAEERANIPVRWTENPDTHDQGRIPDKATAPVYAESVNMLEGLTEEEADTFLQENPCRQSYKTSIQSTPFRMTFGLEAVMPSEFIVPSLRIQSEYKLNESESEHARVEQLLRLEEERIRSMEALEHEQRLRKAFVDRHRKRNEERFGKGKAVLVF